MLRAFFLATVMSALSLGPLLQAQTNNFCMDCIERRIEHLDPGRHWFEVDGFCCPAPCDGYDGYKLEQGDRGFGCLTKDVHNEFMEGDICNSNENDLGCPPSSPGPGGSATVINPDDPIIIDLGEQSYRLTSITEGVLFDVRNDGRPIRTAWTRPGADNAFLALDRNGNGRIDSGAELFGNVTPLRSGALAQNGFEVLEDLDANHDGIVDSRDAAWATLLFWTDRNHDGMSTADELQPVSASAVVGFETDRKMVGRKDQWGNEFRYMAHLRLQHGRHSYYDVFLNAAP